MTQLVSAVVLNFRTGRDAWKCAEALLRQTIADQVEILLVDNHSDNDSIGYIRNRVRHSAPQIRIIETPENIGYGRGNNHGASYAKGEFLLIINPDNELEPDALEKMVAAMQADATIGILAPRLIHEDGTVRASTRSFPRISDLFVKRTALLRPLFRSKMKRYLQEDQDMAEMRDVDWVAGACFLIRRSFFMELGGFDSRFFLFFDDTDLCRRCSRAGKRVVYFPQAVARDRKHRLSEGGWLALLTKKTARIHLVSAIKYFWKWRGA